MTLFSQISAEVVKWRRHLHRHPELSGQEKETAAFISRVLTEHRIEHETGLGGHGIVARIDPGRPGPELAFRADFDALPLTDRKECAYASTRPGVMHACGHDGNTAVLLGLAVLLSRRPESLAGPVRFLFQPAEENGRGAVAMLADGVFDRPPAAIFGFHFFPGLKVGEIALHRRPFMAATEYLEIEVRGRSAHACAPQEAVDAIQVAAGLVAAINQLLTKGVDPVDPALVSIGTISGGTISNIIADRVQMTGTIRTLSADQHQRLHSGLKRLVHEFPRAFGAEAELQIGEVAPALANDPRLVDFMAELLAEDFSQLAVRENDPPMLGGEDFARFARQVPGCYLFVGCGNPEKGLTHPLHSPLFDLDEAALQIILELLAAVARRGDRVAARLVPAGG
jgi:amidohydrolase